MEGNMEKIQRPKKVTRAERQVLTPKNEQQLTQEQFERTYDKLDEIVDVIANGYQGDVGPVRTTRTTR